MDYAVTYDVSNFLDASIEKVVHTLFEALILVSSGSDGSERKRGPLGMFLHVFDRGVEKVTSGYAGIPGLVVTRRSLTMLVISAFTYGIIVVNQVLPSGFVPLEDQGMTYGMARSRV